MPDHISIKAGQKLRIEAHVYGKPHPTCKWMKADQDVLTSSRLAVHKAEGTSVLIIKDVTRKDSDYYSLTAENSSGVATQKIRVIVMGMLDFLLPSLRVLTHLSFMYSSKSILICIYIFASFYRYPWTTSATI